MLKAGFPASLGPDAGKASLTGGFSAMVEVTWLRLSNAQQIQQNSLDLFFPGSLTYRGASTRGSRFGRSNLYAPLTSYFHCFNIQL